MHWRFPLVVSPRANGRDSDTLSALAVGSSRPAFLVRLACAAEFDTHTPFCGALPLCRPCLGADDSGQRACHLSILWCAELPARSPRPLRGIRMPGEQYTYTDRRATSMKRKLTITVDSELLSRPRSTPACVSLSSLVEASLRAVVAEETPPFSERWRGPLEEARRDDARYEALARKYL